MSLMQVPLLKRLKRKRAEVSMLDDTLDGWFCRETGNLAPNFSIGPEDIYLDVGCGQGFMSHFAAAMGASIIATDIDESCLKSTVQQLKKSKARSVQGYVSDSNPLPVESDSCTRVLCMEVMEHVDDPRQLMQELARVTAPGGRLLISVPDPASEAIQKQLAPETYWTKPNHVRILEREQFNQIVADSGLTIISQTYRKFFSTMYWSLFWAADQHLGDPEKPILWYWRKTWESLLESPHGYRVKSTLDGMLPKSQVIIASKPSN